MKGEWEQGMVMTGESSENGREMVGERPGVTRESPGNGQGIAEEYRRGISSGNAWGMTT